MSALLARMAGSEIAKKLGKVGTAIVGKELAKDPAQLAFRLAPDVFFGGLAAVQTPGDLADKLVAGGAQAIGGGLGGIAAGRAAGALGAGGTVQGLVDMAGSFGGDYAGMFAGDAIMRGKDKLMGGEGLNPYERMGKQQQEEYADQIRRDTLMNLGLVNPQRQDYLAELGMS